MKLLATGWILPTMLLTACATTQPDVEHSQWQPNLRDQEVLSSQTFLNSHPDMLNRLRAMQELEKGKPEKAANYFLRAARYADKQAQAAYAEMLWEGRGVPQDRAAAYAWMDLAAERGYEFFLTFRERYWKDLNETERQRALKVGEEIYAEYGDEVAKPRMEKVLWRGSRKVAGSRVGAVGNLEIWIPGPGGYMEISGETFFNERFWKPTHYWQWQKDVMDSAREGKVIVGDLMKTRDESPPPTPADPVD